ncbi:hypothetical protein QQF64_023483 [Cirrhinus molitorella]|uniref:Uncharacterized protein n=1 Tax=Cirrhinus molitorella TaxID=172907 RepID=A0ABR3L5L0_9TELE
MLSTLFSQGSRTGGRIDGGSNSLFFCDVWSWLLRADETARHTGEGSLPTAVQTFTRKTAAPFPPTPDPSDPTPASLRHGGRPKATAASRGTCLAASRAAKRPMGFRGSFSHIRCMGV